MSLYVPPFKAWFEIVEFLNQVVELQLFFHSWDACQHATTRFLTSSWFLSVIIFLPLASYPHFSPLFTSGKITTVRIGPAAF